MRLLRSFRVAIHDARGSSLRCRIAICSACAMCRGRLPVVAICQWQLKPSETISVDDPAIGIGHGIPADRCVDVSLDIHELEILQHFDRRAERFAQPAARPQVLDIELQEPLAARHLEARILFPLAEIVGILHLNARYEAQQSARVPARIQHVLLERSPAGPGCSRPRDVIGSAKVFGSESVWS